MQFLIGIFLVLTQAFAQNYSELIPYPFYAVDQKSENSLVFIDDGISALALRVDMIRRAQTSIEMEYFIYELDTAGKIVAKELIAAAKRGVKVRVLVDKSAAVFELNESYAHMFKENGVEVRYYNAAKIWRVSSVQFRNHRKLLIVDDREALTGGRNIGDDYFDLSHEFNFDDSDLLVQGPMSKVIRESFDLYFEHKISQVPVVPKKLDQASLTFLDETAEEREVRERMESVGRKLLSQKKVYVCPELTFSSDAPGANFKRRLDSKFVDSHRFLRKTLFDKISQVDKKIILSSPYMINSKKTDEMLDILLKNKVAIDLYSNSLGSTDASYVAANMYLGLGKWRKSGINVYLHDGKWLPKNSETPEAIRAAKTGTHSKVQVYEYKSDSEVMVGTYNIDQRSNYYNSEMAVFCRGNQELTNEIKKSIEFNKKYSLVVSENGKRAVDRDGHDRSVYGATKKEVRMMKIITLPSWLLKFLL